MTHSVVVPTASAPPLVTQWLRWIATNNPFYVISAGLFLAGLWISFPDPAKSEDTWALMSGLAGYTLLLAGTALLLVRYCNFWDDVRTLLLLVVLLFLATSVTFDHVLVTEAVDPAPNPHRGLLGFTCFLSGLLFAIAVSETLLRGIHLRLGAWFRVPYYLIMALFFLYPLGLRSLLDKPRMDAPFSEALIWGIFGFAPLAGLVFLTLLPAIRRGPRSVKANGSPWRWPLYPWTLFGMLALAVPARSFLLCWSMLKPVFAQDLDQLVFGPYFLVPFGLALAVLLLEAALVSRRPGLLNAALLAPAGLVALTLFGHRDDHIYQEFLRIFTARLGGDPLYVTLLAVAVFYFYAMLRAAPFAIEALSASLAVLAVIGPNTLATYTFVDPQPLPILAAGIMQLGLGLWRQQSWRCLAAAGLAVAAFLAIPVHDHAWRALQVPIAFHLWLFAILLISEGFDDGLARQLRIVGPCLVLLACVYVVSTPINLPGFLPRWTLNAYVPMMAGVLLCYGLLPKRRTSLVLAGLILACWMAETCWRGYGLWRQMLVGLDYLVLSLALFAVAILISLTRAGTLARWLKREPEDLIEIEIIE
jgi:hypothetical protein